MMETKRPTSPAAEELLNLYFPILNHGFISLVDYSGTDQCIEHGARVSYGSGTRKTSDTRGLLRYLRRHRHTSPSELVQLKFHMCAPIFVLRQFFRHRTLSANEFSGRYSLMPMIFYTPNKEQFKKQSKSNKQGRDVEIDEVKYNAAVKKWNKMRAENAQFYEDLTADDVAREIARIELPLSTYSQLYFTMNLHNLFHFVGLRADSHAQYEIQEYAKVMAGMVKRVVPLSYEAWIDYNSESVNFSRMEMNILRDVLDGWYNDDAKTAVIGLKTGNEINIKSGNYDLNCREIKEFIGKFYKRKIPDYELNLSKAKTPEYFQEKMLAAVPNIDRKANY